MAGWVAAVAVAWAAARADKVAAVAVVGLERAVGLTVAAGILVAGTMSSVQASNRIFICKKGLSSPNLGRVTARAQLPTFWHTSLCVCQKLGTCGHLVPSRGCQQVLSRNK